MYQFEYINTTSLRALSDSLSKEAGQSVILAGGTDLLDRLKERLIQPKRVINIKQIPELHGMQNGKGLSIGALTTIAEMAADNKIRAQFPVLAEAASSIATPQLRNMGTIGGNLCQRPRCWYFRGKEYPCLKKGGDLCYAAEGLNKYHAIFGGGPCFIVHPSDSAPAFIALGAELEIFSAAGTRKLPVEKFFQLPEANLSNEHVLKPDEVITRITVPQPVAGTRSTYLKFREKQSLDFAISSVAALLEMDGKKVKRARIVLGGVAPIPWRAQQAEAELTGKNLSEQTISAAAAAAVANAEPMDQNGFKIMLTRNIVRKALRQFMQA
jgi:xanthine dehydrogenase YagS FAD-binding subunit